MSEKKSSKEKKKKKKKKGAVPKSDFALSYLILRTSVLRVRGVPCWNRKAEDPGSFFQWLLIELTDRLLLNFWLI